MPLQNFCSQLAISNLKVSLDHLVSPTSTLVGHVFSPLPLSPLFSTTKSPPIWPNAMPSGWNTALSCKISSLVCHPLPYDAFMQGPTSGVEIPHVSAHPYVLIKSPKVDAGDVVQPASSIKCHDNQAKQDYKLVSISCLVIHRIIASCVVTTLGSQHQCNAEARVWVHRRCVKQRQWFLSKSLGSPSMCQTKAMVLAF
ncbi:hypothetical protein L7F22_044656 [Adiantum nelumboides]|nr:hypothetical protein [Adiantum nelumboides]